MRGASAARMHAVAFATKRAHLRTLHHLQRITKRLGLTPARYDMLLAIGRGGLLQRDLWRRFDVSRTTVSRMVRALESLGLVTRHRNAGEPSRRVNLTDKGRILLDRAIWACDRLVTRLFESLYPTHRRRRDRASRLTALFHTITALAVGFGDRARCLYFRPEESFAPFTGPLGDD
jgi:DNA-binding MarR family transcriptional regulator